MHQPHFLTFYCILSMLERGLQPSAITYTSLLSCYARCKHPSAKARVEEIYDRLCLEVVNLDARAYGALLAALKRATVPSAMSAVSSGYSSPTHADRAKVWVSSQTLSGLDAYVDKCEYLLLRALDFGLVPSAGCWAKVIHAEPSSPKAYSRALRLYSLMLREGVDPDHDTVLAIFDVFIHVAASEPQAVEIATAIIDKLEQDRSHVLSNTVYKQYINIVVKSQALSAEQKAAIFSDKLDRMLVLSQRNTASSSFERGSNTLPASTVTVSELFLAFKAAPGPQRQSDEWVAVMEGKLERLSKAFI